MSVLTQIPKGTVTNFETILNAHRSERLLLLRAYDKITQKDVTLVCATNLSGEDYEFIPLAIMIEDDPFERFVPPT